MPDNDDQSVEWVLPEDDAEALKTLSNLIAYAEEDPARLGLTEEDVQTLRESRDGYAKACEAQAEAVREAVRAKAALRETSRKYLKEAARHQSLGGVVPGDGILPN
jgi:hypothetical protein